MNNRTPAHTLIANFCLTAMLVIGALFFFVATGSGLGGDWGNWVFDLAYLVANEIFVIIGPLIRISYMSDSIREVAFAVLSCMGISIFSFFGAICIDGPKRIQTLWLTAFMIVYVPALHLLTGVLGGDWNWTYCTTDNSDCGIEWLSYIRLAWWTVGSAMALFLGAMLGNSFVSVLYKRSDSKA